MTIEIKIPSPGESITEVELASWFVENGEQVEKDQEVGEIESEKATLPLIAEKGGKIELLAEVGDTLKVGDVACKIDTSAEGNKKETPGDQETNGADGNKEDAEKKQGGGEKTQDREEKQEDKKKQLTGSGSKQTSAAEYTQAKTTPVARKMMEEEGWNIDDIINGLRKISSADVQAVKERGGTPATGTFSKKEVSREQQRTGMSQLRKKISERLVAVNNETAMLTTFNEADMSEIMALRKKYQDRFVEKHGIKLGFMSFFTKAVTMALQQFPNVNSFLDENEIVTPAYCDVGIAVQTDKGLMVPIIRNTETLGLAEIEQQIMEIAGRARKNRISMDELSGGTFTITNGGIFGSMLSTPILNPPQSAILGMHNIIDRPVALNGKVEIRPMMYIALSYDHRVIDGRDSVGFLKTVKEFIENPTSMLFGPQDQEKVLLDL
ncbi:MAG: 2-oxoglutarate dehydrogenase complex dihydrolipoyllysine-residue succinyltransferase [Bacteroidales bacterium]|nr:2-oxoglutarate dehydrogenase complex dihydrolipoyllysine-residue succinyltransferase [Bacteroidales bacterium]MDT8432761.1 2-oxoglutarate dehydrogenase complex dihydrolipoyllysine-residue succinyltransferase [Bacteroidales bacterium]